jgi:amino acid transporter
VFSGVLLGIFLLANFDSAINMIEEAKTPVRTVQRALVLVIFGELVLYSVAAIGWARAVPPAVLAHLPASYQGTAMTYVTNLYVHGPLRYIPAIVVITSAVANLQMAMNAGARETYRMAKQGKLPHVFAWVHSRYKTPWATALTIAVLSWIMLAALGNSESLYINSVTILWSAVYISSVLAFIVLVVRRTGKWWLTIVPWAAIGMMLYAGATAGTPALIFGGAWIAGGVLLMIYNELRGKHGKVDAVPEWTLENTRGVGE